MAIFSPRLLAGAISNTTVVGEPVAVEKLRRSYQGNLTSIFTNNKAHEFGGAIRCYECTMIVVSGAKFEANKA